MSFDPTPRAGYAASTWNEDLTEILNFSPADYVDQIPEPDLETASGGGGPTGGPLLPRDETTPGFAPFGGIADATSSWIDLPRWVPWFFGVVIVVGLIALVVPASKWWRRRRHLARLRQGDIAAAWEDITDRLADLGDPVRPSATAMETATAYDDAFVPLAVTFYESLYGEREATTSVIDRAEEAHAEAVDYVAGRYSTKERTIAVFRPTRMLKIWSSFTASRRNGNR
jgi:hypothetical protein